MDKKNKSEFRLEIGDVVIGLICPSKEYAESMKDYFGVENSSEKPDIRLTLNIIPHKNSIDVPDSLFKNKIVKGNNFFIGDNLVSGFFNSKKRIGNINVKVGLTIGPVTRVFEQLLYQAFYTAVKIIKNNSILIHSTGIIFKDKGFLFFGPSGSGKSTVANLSRDYHVLNDEICLVEFRGKSIFLHWTPFNGYFKRKKSGNALLKAMFYLKHGKNNIIYDIKESTAIKSLAKEIIPTVGLNELINSSTFLHMLDLSKKLFNTVAVKELQFLPNNGFWKIIEQKYF